jgi:hypothetical protein
MRKKLLEKLRGMTAPAEDSTTERRGEEKGKSSPRKAKGSHSLKPPTNGSLLNYLIAQCVLRCPPSVILVARLVRSVTPLATLVRKAQFQELVGVCMPKMAARRLGFHPTVSGFSQFRTLKHCRVTLSAFSLAEFDPTAY